MNMPNEIPSGELKQLLLELHYDLLDDAEAAELRSRIENDADVATAWAKTLQLADKMASAAKVDGVAVPPMRVPAEAPPAEQKDAGEQSSTPSAEPVIRFTPDPESKPRIDGRRFWVSAIGLFATAASIGFLLLGNRYMQNLPARPGQVVRLDAQAAIAHRATGDNEFEIKTSLVNGTSGLTGGFQVVPATISFSIFSGDSVLFRGSTETGDSGGCMVAVPDDLVIPPGSKLSVTANPIGSSAEATTLEIPLEPTRCLTYVKTDRPVYRPGEKVYFRSVTLNRRSLSSHVDVPIHYELVDPSGAVVDGAVIEGVTQRGVGNGSFAIASTAPGGAYRIVAKSMDGFFPDEIVDFQVRVYRVPRFKKELELDRRSYGPGDRVEAEFSAQRAEGGPVAGASVRVQAMIDEEVVHQSTATTSADGTLAVAFTLPQHIEQGVGQLSVMIDDGGTQETQSKTIPIQLGRVEVDFYPEGGYLVDGLKNRVYFAARNTLGDPIHIAGEVQSRNGTAVATIETIRDGMGRFEFVPRHGERYTLKVTSPVDVTNLPKLPAVTKSLPVLESGDGVFEHDAPLLLTVRHTKSMKAIVRAVCRGQLVGQKEIDIPPGSMDVQLPLRGDAAGVIRLTILDASMTPAQPLVERLVYRREKRQLNVSVIDPKPELQRSPGEPMRLTLQVTDEDGSPMPAVLGVRVVDDASLSLDETERPSLRSHFLLTSEVESPEDLEHANFYLSDDAEAAESLDLLLGTQGWRRFISGSPDQPSVDFRQQLVRLLELDGTTAAAPKPPVSNAAVFVDEWTDYRRAVSVAWRGFLRQARVLALVLVGVFMLLVLYRLRQSSWTTAMIWLVIASSTLAMIGFGGSREATVVGSVDSVREAAANDDQMSKQADSAPTPRLKDEGMEKAAERGISMDEGMAMGDTGPPTASSQSPAESRSAKSVGEVFDAQAEKAIEVAKNIVESRTLSQDKLQRFLASRGLDAEALADQLLDELRFPVRQYAHRYKKSETGTRRDFTETLLWQPLLVTDSKGQASIRFDLSDSVTSYRIDVDGHTFDGRIGSGNETVTSRIPFQVEPKLPLEVTTGDRIDLPVAVINATNDDISVNVDLEVGRSLQRVDSDAEATTVAAGQRTRVYFPLDVGRGQAQQVVPIMLHGQAGSAGGEWFDRIQRELHISPAGYPARKSIAGQINGREKVSLPIPTDIVAGSLAVTLRAYPSPVADLMAGVESILREPHGCFEQTSATNYPNTMALLYLQKNKIAKPEISRRALNVTAVAMNGSAKILAMRLCPLLG